MNLLLRKRLFVALKGGNSAEQSLLLTEPEGNLPSPRNKGGEQQNYLKIYPGD